MKKKQTMNLLLLVGVGIGAWWLWRENKGGVSNKEEFTPFTNYGLGGTIQTTKTPPPTGHILADTKLSQKYGRLGFCGC